MSNRFKNLNLKNDDKPSKKTNKKVYQTPKLKENSRWKRNDVEEPKNRFQSSRNEDTRRTTNTRIPNDNIRSKNNRNYDRNRGRNNFNRKYKAGYKPPKPSGEAPCAADRFGINFKNLEKFDTKQNKMMEKKKVIEKPKIMKMEKEEEYELTEEDRKLTLAMAQQYQYFTESEEDDEELDDDVSSVDSMENWKPQHL